jgi:tetratricopeptide (TPR) repeat protein
MRRAVAAYRKVYPGDNPNTAYSLQNLAGWLLEDEDYATAETLLDEALAMNQRILPADHPDIAITQSGMAALRLETGHPELGLEFASTARESLINSFGADHWRVAWAGALEGASLTRLGSFAAAEPLLLDAHGILDSSLGARQAQLQSTLRYLSELYMAWGRPEDAEKYQALMASN